MTRAARGAVIVLGLLGCATPEAQPAPSKALSDSEATPVTSRAEAVWSPVGASDARRPAPVVPRVTIPAGTTFVDALREIGRQGQAEVYLHTACNETYALGFPLTDMAWDEALRFVVLVPGGRHDVWFAEHGRRAYVEYTCMAPSVVDEMPDRGWLDQFAVRVWPVAPPR